MTARATWGQLERVRHAVLSLRDFEQWVYAQTDLESALGETHASTLQAFDYRPPHADLELFKVIDAIYAELRPGALIDDALRRLFTDFLAGKTDLRTTARSVCALRGDGLEVPTDFIYIDSELDEIPALDTHHLWDPEVLPEVMAQAAPRLGEFERAAREVAREWLAADRDAPS